VTKIRIALIAANIYLYLQVDHLREEVAKVSVTLSTELGSLRDASTVTTASQARHLEKMKEDLEAARAQARDQARSLSSQAKAEAQAHADQLARQIQAEEAKVQQQVNSEISEVKTSANTANAKIADVSTDVGGVKTQVSATQAELQKTIADLKSTRAKADLGNADAQFALGLLYANTQGEGQDYPQAARWLSWTNKAPAENAAISSGPQHSPPTKARSHP